MNCYRPFAPLFPDLVTRDADEDTVPPWLPVACLGFVVDLPAEPLLAGEART